MSKAKQREKIIGELIDKVRRDYARGKITHVEFHALMTSMKDNPTMRIRNFTQILEPHIVGYTTTLADGLTVEFFRTYNTVWAVHTITAEGERRAIEAGTHFENAYKIARKTVRAHKLMSV